MSSTFPVKLLMCPHCESKFELFLYSFAPHYGLLRCVCREYPIVFSIPILADFDASEEVLNLIRERESKEALALTIGSFATNPGFQPGGPLDPRKKDGREKLLKILDDPLVSFHQMLQSLCTSREADRMFFRFSSSSVVAGLGLAALSSEAPGTILHLGCGAGHLERLLSSSLPAVTAVGVEENFSFLYAARRYLAPEGHFVFANLSGSLPLMEESVDVVLADERLGSSPETAHLGSEISRVVRPDEGAVLAPGKLIDSASLFASHPRRRLSRKRLVESFVREHIVDATIDDKNHGEASVVATKQLKIFQKKGMEGFLNCRSPRVNPVYTASEEGETLKLERRSDLPPDVLDPSLVEAGALPERIEFSKQIIRDLQDGTSSPEAVDLVFRMVLVDLPLEYS